MNLSRTFGFALYSDGNWLEGISEGPVCHKHSPRSLLGLACRKDLAEITGMIHGKEMMGGLVIQTGIWGLSR